MFKAGKAPDIKSKSVVYRGWREGEWVWVSFVRDKNVLKLDHSDANLTL